MLLANRFKKIIICNPFGFGFDTYQNSEKLLKELLRIGTTNAEITIIGSDKNPYFKPLKIVGFIEQFKTNHNHNFTEKLSAANFSSYSFSQTLDNNTPKPLPTIPNYKLVINKI